MLWIRSALYAAFLVITVIPLWAPLPMHWRYRLTVGWPILAVWGARVICGIRWKVEGIENLPDAPAVVLSKHQSAWETCFLPYCLPRQVCFVYKKELHLVPFFGWGLGLLGMIPIDREKGRDAFDQVVAIGTQRLNSGIWPLLFPEGTRVAPGKVGRYKMGGALLATQAGVPVIPVAHNAGECWRRNAFIKYPGLVTVRFGPVIPSTGLTPDELNARVQEWIEGEMHKLNPERYPTRA